MTPDSNQPSGGRTRRDVLRTCAATAATGLGASVAGCSSGLPPLTGDTPFGPVDVPETGDPEYRKWAPAPAALDIDDPTEYTITWIDPAPLADGSPEEFVARRSWLIATLDYFGVGYENYEYIVDNDHATVFVGDFEAATVTDTLADTAYEPDGTYDGYDLFARSDVPRRVAVRDGTVVWSNAENHDNPDVESTIDAGEGRIDRYHETDDAFARISDVVGTCRRVSLDVAQGDAFDAQIAADAFLFDDAAGYQVRTALFPEGAEPTESKIESVLDDRTLLTSDAGTIDVEVDGRIARVKARIDRGSGDPDWYATVPPHVTWGASHDPEAETVTFHHEAGEPVAVDLLAANFDDDTDDEPNHVERHRFWPGEGPVGPGDSASVDLADHPDSNVVELRYSDDEEFFYELFRYKLEYGDANAALSRR